MDRIKVVYDWIGPNGPIPNTNVPNVYDIAASLPQVQVNVHKYNFHSRLYPNLFSKFPQHFQLTPSCDIQPSDTFIYEICLHHLTDPFRFFTIGEPPGIIENSLMYSNVLHGIKHGNGYLLIEFMFEAIIDYNFLDKLHSYIRHHGIPFNKVIYICGCANAEELYDRYCNLHGISTDQKMKIINWDIVEWNLSIWFNNIQNNQYDYKKHVDIIEKNFLCFNRRFRTHRTKLILLMKKHNLLKDSWYSMGFENPDGGPVNFRHQIDKNFTDKMEISEEQQEELIKLLPLEIDSQKNLSVMINDTNRSSKYWYEKSLLSIVTETLAESDIISVTEKTFKPIFYKQPFILLGAPKSLEYLRKRGYKTFSKWFDESYDDIENHDDRINKIVLTCVDINNWSIDRKTQFIKEVKEVVDHNYSIFLNKSKNLDDTFWLKLGDQK